MNSDQKLPGNWAGCCHSYCCCSNNLTVFLTHLSHVHLMSLEMLPLAARSCESKHLENACTLNWGAFLTTRLILSSSSPPFRTSQQAWQVKNTYSPASTPKASASCHKRKVSSGAFSSRSSASTSENKWDALTSSLTLWQESLLITFHCPGILTDQSVGQRNTAPFSHPSGSLLLLAVSFLPLLCQPAR